MNILFGFFFFFFVGRVWGCLFNIFYVNTVKPQDAFALEDFLHDLTDQP